MPRSPTFSSLSKGICAFTKKVGDLNLCYGDKEKGKRKKEKIGSELWKPSPSKSNQKLLELIKTQSL
jgi:hypothetical protein